MTNTNQILATIAKQHLGIPTLERRNSDSLDFYDLSVGSVAAALKAAFDAGTAITSSSTTHSPAPWGYEYSPYTLRATGTGDTDAVGKELPAFEVFDAAGNKVFDTNEDTAAELQEANACLGAAAPAMRAALEYAESQLSGFKADALKNLGLDVALEEIRNAIANAAPKGGRA